MADRKGPKHRIVQVHGDRTHHWLPYDAVYTLCGQNNISRLEAEAEAAQEKYERQGVIPPFPLSLHR